MPAAPPRPEPATPPVVPRPRRRGRLRVALLGLFGALALALPLSQVLQLQGQALLEHRAERIQLDPLADAMAVHRGLSAHDEVATRVLRGRRALEPERRERAAAVDSQLDALQHTLQALDAPPARREAAVMQADWQRLAGEVALRRIEAAASQRGHRLLKEQALQVLDLVLAQQDGAMRHALAALPPAHWPAIVAARQGELDALARRAAASQRAAALGLGLLGTLALLGAMAWARGKPVSAPPGGAGPPAVRRGHGRRAGDRPAEPSPATIADAELQTWRRRAENTPSDG